MNKFIKITTLHLLILLLSFNVNAVHLSSNGTGQVLVFPYYTVNGGFNSLINLVNTTDEPKALRVRFREAANGREVFAFNLYLGAHDVWVGALGKSNQDQGLLTKLKSSDASCTLPTLNGGDVFFNNDKYTGDFQDAYGTDINRMHEGFIEIIEMGVLTGDSAAATIINDAQPRADCSVLQNAWNIDSDNSYWLTDANTDMLPPSGGIMGNVVLINVGEGIAVSEEATAIDDFSDVTLNFNIDNDSPSLADGKTTSIVDASDGKKYTMQWATGFEAVSSILMKSTIANEYVLSDSIGANTDWIITMPTKQYHTDPRYKPSGDIAIDPFLTLATDIDSCEEYDETGIYNREEQTTAAGSVIGLPPPGVLYHPILCSASNYIFITEGGDVRISSNTIFESNYFSDSYQYNNPGFDTGWLEFGFEQSAKDVNQNYEITGLPMIGFSVQRYSNDDLAGGVLANYAGIFKHKTTTVVNNLSNQNALSGMSIAKDNKGQVLLYPYYTVRNGMNTLISVVNTTGQVKALKVRFLEGRNSRECLDFNLYLSPYDVWVAALIATTSSISGNVGQESLEIRTNDTSCTVPSIYGQEFLPYAFSGAFDDGLGNDMQRCTEGHFEIIEMGTLVGDDALAATHVAGTPANCSTLHGNWIPGVGQWSIDPTVNMQAPDGLGSLYGSVSLIDVADGIDMTYDATAIVNYNTELTHTYPGSLLPNLSSGNQTTTLIDTDDGMLQTTWGSPIDAVSALFMQAQINNDYVISDSIGAQTEWINTFPTRRFYVDPMFAEPFPPLAPFNTILTEGIGTCEMNQFYAYSRDPKEPKEINVPAVGIVVSGEYLSQHCWSVNIIDTISYEDDMNTLFDSNLLIDHSDNPYPHLQFESTTGWMQADFTDEDFYIGKLVGIGANGDTHEIYGRPILGFVAQKYVNDVLDDGNGNSILANYAVINMNKNARKTVITPAQ